MKFLELGFQNFQSYGNNLTVINLDFNTTTLIIGKNFDSVVDGQVDSNGAGKTTILNALTYCTYGKTISKMAVNNLVNDINEKNLYVYVTFKKGNTFYKIERYRKNKAMGGEGAKIYINTKNEFSSEHDKTPDSINNVNAFIQKIIGIPFEIFARIVVFSASYEPFLSLPSSHESKANQRDIIEELFGLTELSEKADLLKAELNSNKRQLSDLVLINDRIKSEMERYSALIDGYKSKSSQWESDHSLKLNDAKNNLKSLSEIDLEFNLEILQKIKKYDDNINVINSEVKDITNEINLALKTMSQHDSWEISQMEKIHEISQRVEELSQLNFEEFKKINEDIQLLETEIKELKVEANAASNVCAAKKTILFNVISEISTLESNKCPYCSQAYHDTKDKLEECFNVQKEAETEHDKHEWILKTIKLKIEKIETKLNELSQKRKYDSVSIIRMEQELSSKRVRLDEMKNETNPHQATLNETDLGEKRDYIDTCNESIEKLKKKKEMLISKLDSGILTESDIFKKRSQIEIASQTLKTLEESRNPYTSMITDATNVKFDDLKTDEINDLDVYMKHQDFLLKLLTKKDSFIRKALLNKCLPFLNQKLNGYLSMIGLPHKVMFTEEMEAKISRFDIEIPFENLSSGQKARVNLALSFAFRDVLQSRFDKINFCILDECLDVGLGTVGVQLATNMIKTVARTNDLSMFVISHRDEITSMFPEKLEIHMKNGFSQVVKE